MKSTAWLTVAVFGFWGATLPARAQEIYSFNQSPDDGLAPLGGLVSDGARSLYGTTSGGGTNRAGTVYRLVPPALPKGRWREEVLHSFPATAGDGARPTGDLLPGAGGVLYGTTGQGGPDSDGTVFSLTRPSAGGQAWTETVLHAFTEAEGRFTNGGVIADASGALYGVASYGGPLDTNEGTVYRLVPPAAGATSWTEQTLHSFDYSAGDGQFPIGPLARDAAGNLYGVTAYGGGRCDCGVAYRLSPPAAGQTAWTETILHEFAPGLPGRLPGGGLVLDAHGVLFGTTSTGGEKVGRDAQSGGLVFQLVPPTAPGSPWVYKTIFLFDGDNGGAPRARLTLSVNGNLYGTTYYGGATPRACTGGCGTMFKLAHPGSGGYTWTETYVAVPGRYAGRRVAADVLIGPDHALYTTSSEGGFKGGGSVLRVTPDMLQGADKKP